MLQAGYMRFPTPDLEVEVVLAIAPRGGTDFRWDRACFGLRREGSALHRKQDATQYKPSRKEEA
jgi:hypothetical protein